jgi:hypothetical protein
VFHPHTRLRSKDAFQKICFPKQAKKYNTEVMNILTPFFVVTFKLHKKLSVFQGEHRAT